MKLKQGDNVIVIAGKDKGRRGKIVEMVSARESALVEGLNLHKKHRKPRRSGEKGQIIEIPHPIHLSNLSIVDPKNGNPTRVGYRFEGGKKVRYAKKSGAVFA